MAIDAIVTGQRKADADLQRIEQNIDKMAKDPYAAAMRSGANLLRDASPAHRRPEDRQRMLGNAQQTFSDAIGFADDRPVDLARAHVMYGLTWLALGEPRDLTSALTAATRILQEEVLTAFQLSCRWERDQERRQAATTTRIRDAIFGREVISDWSASDRWVRAQSEHDAVWQLYLLAEGSSAYPRLVRPHGTTYSHPRPGLPVHVTISKAQRLLDVDLTLAAADLTVSDHGDSLVRAQLVTPVMDAQHVISPDVSALDRTGILVRPGETARIPHAGPGRPAACLSLGHAEGVDLRVLLHTELDSSSPLRRTRAD